jgi:glycosyltransferase involved in cell wall biosynthesis
MKFVVHLNASSGGGAFTVAQRLSLALNETGQIQSDHLVFTGKPGKYHFWSHSWWRKKWSFLLHALEKLDFLRFEKNANVRFAFSHGKTGINILNEPLIRSADIVHLHWVNKGFVSLHGIDKLLASGKQVVWTCHDQWPFTGGCYYSGSCVNYKSGCGNCPMLKNPGIDDLSRAVFKKKADIFSKYSNLTFITPSDWLRGVGLNSGTANGRNIITIPNAINTDIFGLKKPELCTEFVSNNRKKFTFLFAAVNIADKRKGFDEFQKFCEALIDRGFMNFRVIYVGENKGQFVPSPKFEQGFTGYISDPVTMAEWYQKSDLYITTSNDDNLPTTIMESLACGTPAAAFAVGGIPEMIDDESTGVLAEVYNIEELANKVVSLLEGRFGSSLEIAMRCRKFAVENYDKTNVALRHLALYAQLLK